MNRSSRMYIYLEYMSNTALIRQNLDQMRNDVKALTDSFSVSTVRIVRLCDSLYSHIHQWGGSNTTNARLHSGFGYVKFDSLTVNVGSQSLATIPDAQLVEAYNVFELGYFKLVAELAVVGGVQKSVLKAYNEHSHAWARLPTKQTTAFSEPNFFLDSLKVVQTLPPTNRWGSSRTLDQAQAMIRGWNDQLIELKTAATVAEYWSTDFIRAYNNHTHYWWPGYTTAPLTSI